MKNRFLAILSLGLFISLMGIFFIVKAESPKESRKPEISAQTLPDEIKKRVEAPSENETLIISEEPLTSFPLLKVFYQKRNFQPAWKNESGLTGGAFELVNALSKADREGLNPQDYHLAPIKDLVSVIQNKQAEGLEIPSLLFTNLDLLLTDAFLTYGSHLFSGRINPDTIDNEWFSNRRAANLPAVLEEGLVGDNIHETLKDLLPTQPYYARLRVALEHLRTIEKNGGWEKFPEGVAIKKGDTDPRIPILRRRLKEEGDLNQKPNDKDVFDQALSQALIRFQKRHGLDPDGQLGTATLETLNIPVEQRINQIILNMERCRWLPANLGDWYILVNIANFELDVIENDDVALNMRVVVGQKYKRTPVFSSTMSYIVLNPTWTVPKKIARLEVIPTIQKDPAYISKENFKVFASYEDNAPVVDPQTIDWSKVDPKTSELRLVQQAGKGNALGNVKFIFPNTFDVYLHDTPSKNLFQKTVRNFSHGCIRLEKPIELAEFLLHINGAWTREKILTTIQKGGEQFVQLPKPIPVHILYWTAWVTPRGKIQFRDDIYGRDIPLDRALHGKLQAP